MKENEDVVTTGFYTESDLIDFGTYLLESYAVRGNTTSKEMLLLVSSALSDYFNTVK